MSNPILNKYKTIFSQTLQDIYEQPEIESVFRLVIEHVFETSYIKFNLEPSNSISTEKEQQLSNILERLKQNEPIQHILGKAHFYELEFFVNRNVLVPRQETEVLVHILVEKFKRVKEPQILDIGTGSGCIAVSLKKNLPNARVIALDVSKPALNIARQNAALNGTDITFLQDDILYPAYKFTDKFDLIVSNPPYVRNSEKQQMHSNVVDFDPELALFVSDKNPLIFYKEITRFARQNLSSNGLLAFEINEAFGKETEQIILEHNFISRGIIKDLNGKDRFVTGVIL